MKREQIESHPAWIFISKQSSVDRYHALTGKNATLFIKAFSCSLEEWPYSRMSEIPKDWARISVTDPFRNISYIMVAKPE